MGVASAESGHDDLPGHLRRRRALLRTARLRDRRQRRPRRARRGAARLAWLTSGRRTAGTRARSPARCTCPAARCACARSRRSTRSGPSLCTAGARPATGRPKAALEFAKLGYQVKEMIGGFEYWVREGFAYDMVSGPVQPKWIRSLPRVRLAVARGDPRTARPDQALTQASGARSMRKGVVEADFAIGWLCSASCRPGAGSGLRCRDEHSTDHRRARGLRRSSRALARTSTTWCWWRATRNG